MIRILIVEDHSMVLDGLQRLLQGEPDIAVVATARSVGEAVDRLGAAPVDVAVVDLRLPDGSGLDVVRAAATRQPQVRAVILTANLSAHDFTLARRLDVRGVVMKEDAFAALTRCLRIVASGGVSFPARSGRTGADDGGPDRSADEILDALTARELEIARLTAGGLRTRDVGAELGIAPGTVKIHLSRIYEKLSIASRVELANVLNRRAAG